LGGKGEKKKMDRRGQVVERERERGGKINITLWSVYGNLRVTSIMVCWKKKGRKVQAKKTRQTEEEKGGEKKKNRGGCSTFLLKKPNRPSTHPFVLLQRKKKKT